MIQNLSFSIKKGERIGLLGESGSGKSLIALSIIGLLPKYMSISGSIKITNKDKVIVFLDSNHTHNHVIEELNLYSKLVSKGSYIVVFDTHVEDMPSDFIWEDRPWGKGNNPKTAVWEYLKSNNEYI
mgnify:CR=1 FL=1